MWRTWWKYRLLKSLWIYIEVTTECYFWIPSIWTHDGIPIENFALKTTLGPETLQDKGRGVAGIEGVCSLHLHQMYLYEPWVLPSAILLPVTHKGVRKKNCWYSFQLLTWMQKRKEDMVWHTWHNCWPAEKMGDIRGVHLQRALYSTWVTTTYSTVPRTTPCTPCCSLTSVLLPPARHRWTHPCRQLCWQNQHCSPGLSEDEACRSGTVRMYFILPLFLWNNSPSYPCWSILSWESFSGRQLFSKQAWVSHSQDYLTFAYESKNSDLHSQEDRRKSHLWPRSIPIQTLLLTSSRYLAEAF